MSVRARISCAICVGSCSTLDSSFTVYIMSYLIPIVAHIKEPTLDRYALSGSTSCPRMIFLSVRPGVKIVGLSGILKFSCNFFVKVDIDSCIVPFSTSCFTSRPRKSLGKLNLESK